MEVWGIKTIVVDNVEQSEELYVMHVTAEYLGVR
jgi:hypothetical protein